MEVIDEVLDLFIELDATEKQLDCPLYMLQQEMAHLP